MVGASPSPSLSEYQFPEFDSVQQERIQAFLRERSPCEMLSRISQDVTTVALKYQAILSQLVHLKFEACGYEADPFLFCITAPKLRSLEVIHHKGLHSLSAGMFALLYSDFPPLSSLTIYDPDMDKETVVRILSITLPALEHLELCVAPVGNRVMRALTLTSRGRDSMPNIRKLILPECTASNGHLADMVMSRRPVLQELKLSLPTTIKTSPRRRTMAKKQYVELRHLREVTRNWSGTQFSLTVD